MPKNPIQFNDITRYQYFVFFFLFLCKVPIFWHILNLIFLSPPMEYRCKVMETGASSGVNSLNYCPCENPQWNRSVFTMTMQTKFGLLCDRAWLVSLSQSVMYIGTLIGSLLFGYLSDKFGRLTSLCLSCLILGVSGCLVTVMPYESLFTLFRCFEGMGVGGAIVTSYVLLVEYCGIRHREGVSALFHLPINVSVICLAGISYLLRNCDHFQLALSVPIFLFSGMYWLLTESPKWLIDKNKVEKAVKVMKKIAKFNGTLSETIKDDIEAYHANKTKASTAKVKIWQIFKHRKLTINFFCMAVIYFVCGMGYYGVSQYIGKMNGNIHINVALSGLLLIPGTIAACFLLRILNRRPFLMATNFLSGLFMIVVICIPSHLHWARVVFACICNTFFFMSFIIVFLYAVELFPTTIRNSVLGFLSVMSRVGQIVAPPINSLHETSSGAIFGAMAILGAILSYPLPETKNTELPSSLEDSKTMSRKKSTSTEPGTSND